MNICIYGAARNQIDKVYIEAGEVFGRELAKRGHNLVFGGGAGGMMGAVARGITEENLRAEEAVTDEAADEKIEDYGTKSFADEHTVDGKIKLNGLRQSNIIAVAPADMNVDDEEFAACSEFIRTEDLSERKRIFIDLADAFVVMPGGFGTYDEFFDLISVMRLEKSLKDCKPVAVYNVNSYYEPMRQMIEKSIEEGFIAEWGRGLYRICDTAEELWGYIETAKPRYPEECCDASEVTEEDFDAYWERKSTGSFWKSQFKK